MDIELYSGSAKAIISTHGGYVTNLSDDNGDILYPKRTLTAPDGSEKVRGGCHVCMPNFGPGGESGLSQHGFGRTSEWSVVEQAENMVVLSLNGQGDYAFLDAVLRYEVLDGVFEMSLTLKNFGDEPLEVAPGFHPYFMHGNRPIEIDGEAYDNLDELAGTKFVDGNRRIVKFGGQTIRMYSEQLDTWALWTDQLGPYVCVEPTQSGYAFAEDISRADTLKWGESKTYECTITW